MSKYGVPCLDLSQALESPQLFQPLSLWKLVEQHVPGPEQWEVKNMLGENLVDESLQLHAEVWLLTDILKEQENQAELFSPIIAGIPEPPQVRDRLITEISFFVDSIQEKLESHGISSSKILAKYNKNVLDYVNHQKTKRDFTGSSRPSSSLSLSSDGQYNSLSSPSTGRSSQSSSLNEEIQEMSQSLNILQIDEVVHHLRLTLKTEISQLLNDIEVLQIRLSEIIDLPSSENGSHPSKPIPTLSELRQERTMLEKEFLKETENDVLFSASRRNSSCVKDRKIEQPSRECCSAPLHQRRTRISQVTQNPDVLERDKMNRPISSIPSANNLPNVKSLLDGQFVPRPPTVGQPKTPSVDKFRRMVYLCRNNEAL